MRSDVDALIYEVGPQLTLTHKSALNAFGFVQASKRDKRFMGFTYNNDWAVIVESRRHVYIYRQPEPNSIYADQYVVDLEDGRSGGKGGEVLGAQQIAEDCIAILTEDSVAFLVFERRSV